MNQKPFELNQKGQKLRGTLYLSDLTDQRLPAVIMLHGIGDDRIGASFMFAQLGRALANAGIHAISFDFRGSGESDGDFSKMCVSGQVQDAQAVIQWVAAQRFVDRTRISIIGFSLGGLVAACCAQDSLASIALIAPTTAENINQRVTSGQDPVMVGPHALHPEFFDDVNKLKPIEQLAKYNGPVFMIQGADDKRVPGHISKAYREARTALNKETQFVCVDNANHGFTDPAPREVLIDKLVAFMKQSHHA